VTEPSGPTGASGPRRRVEGAVDAAASVLGYLNFSSGSFDPAAWRGMSDLFAAAEPHGERPDSFRLVAARLSERLVRLVRDEPAFRDASQCRAVLNLVFERVLPGYRAFHCDLLEHQPPGAIERPYFVMAAAQAVLQAGGPWDEADRLVEEAVTRLNDYVGWRPVAVLENNRQSDPYPHEKVRPVPLFVQAAGVASGRYAAILSGSLEILSRAPATLLAQADFDLGLLEELAIDPRAFDFLHPAASRPNYLFGLWDPARIDGRGHYRRLVVQEATLDGILSWTLPENAEEGATHRRANPEEAVREASGVLSGVILMAAGLSGSGPGTLQASLPLAELLPRIAGYRDDFYRWLLTTLPPAHRKRLDAEAERLRQPFGGVRRHINGFLAGRRAAQVESVTLAAIFARLGRAEAAERLAGLVPAASARMLSRITGRIVEARRLGDRDPAAALCRYDEATDLVFRAVGCGAMVDPWNILGFGGHFPLHDPGGESLPDPRIDDLVNTTGSLLDGYAAICRRTALGGDPAIAARAAASLEKLAVWWDRYATATVGGLPRLSGREVLESTREVIAALDRRRETSPSPPPPGFWRREVGGFSSTRSHADAVGALLAEGDLDGAMGLVVHWASLLEESLTDQSGRDWLDAAGRWLAAVRLDPSLDETARRTRERRFLELVDANTSSILDSLERFAAAASRGRSGADFGSVGAGRDRDPSDADDAALDGDERSVDESVAAAYESMVWQDSADDGVEGGLADAEGVAGRAGESEEVLDAIEDAAMFLSGVSRLVRQTVIGWCRHDGPDARAEEGPQGETARPERRRTDRKRAESSGGDKIGIDEHEVDSLLGWRLAGRRLRKALVRAAEGIAAEAAALGTAGTIADSDRIRLAADNTAEQLTDTAVSVTETLWVLSARLRLVGVGGTGSTGRLVAAVLGGDAAAADAAVRAVEHGLEGRKVLYVPLSRGGRPRRIVRARARVRLLERSVAALPRLGLVERTAALVNLARALEGNRPSGGASVSEFDRLFEAATTALVERIARSAEDDSPRVLDGLSQLVPRLLETWTQHARQLRLSVLERLKDDTAFAAVRQFVERYGRGLFTQHLLAPGSLRGILRGGVRRWIDAQMERAEGSHEEPLQLYADIAAGVVDPRQAAARLRLVFESIAENHAEYRDWNSTTTQSDRGDTLHILLDFLRVKAEYDRIAWTLRPVNMAHRVLAVRGAHDAATAWRRRVQEETDATWRALVERLTGLERQWGVRLASVADRVGRPFSAALEQDELEALVPPAVDDLRGEAAPGRTGPREGDAARGQAAGEALEKRAEALLGVAPGSGVEMPLWLERLERCVDRALSVPPGGRRAGWRFPESVPWLPMAWDDLARRMGTDQPG
jgi:hypothetical protein